MSVEPTQPGALAWTTVARVEDSASIHDGPAVFLTQFAALSEAERHLLATHWCDYEVCNGGFIQFFQNSTGVLAPEAVEGYRALGLTEVASTVEAAMRRLGSTYPRDRPLRQAQVERLRSSSPLTKRPFGDLDDRYYALLPDRSFGKAADKFAATHVV